MRFEPQATAHFGFFAPRDGDDMTMNASIDVIAGFRINDYLRIGAGSGYEIGKFEFSDRYAHGTANAYAIPVLADLKVNMAPSSFVSPFINFTGGYSFNVSNDEYLDAKSGYRATVSLGVDIFNIVLGAHYTVHDWGCSIPNQIIGVSVGVCFR